MDHDRGPVGWLPDICHVRFRGQLDAGRDGDHDDRAGAAGGFPASSRHSDRTRPEEIRDPHDRRGTGDVSLEQPSETFPLPLAQHLSGSSHRVGEPAPPRIRPTSGAFATAEHSSCAPPESSGQHPRRRCSQAWPGTPPTMLSDATFSSRSASPERNEWIGNRSKARRTRWHRMVDCPGWQ